MEEIFTGGEDCLYYEPEDSVDLREKIEILLADLILREKIAAGGHQKVLENFTCEQMANRLEKSSRLILPLF